MTKARSLNSKNYYQKQQYEHSLKVSDYQTLIQKQQEQVNSLRTQLDTVDDELKNPGVCLFFISGKDKKG